MALNGNVEDPQNWPFSVRYTASPYRKSKFPVDTPPFPSPGDGNTNALQNPELSQLVHHQRSEQLVYYNRGHQTQEYDQYPTNPTPSSNFNGNGQDLRFYQPSYQQYCYIQQQPQFHPQMLGNLSTQGQYGLPLPFQPAYHLQHMNHGQYFTRNQNVRTRTRHPHQFPKESQSVRRRNGIIDDEGYIEDLQKRPPSDSIQRNLFSTEHGNQDSGPNRHSDSDPYSYVYDSKNVRSGISILERLQRDSSLFTRSPIETGQRNSAESDPNVGIDHTVSSAHYKYNYNNPSENEYEEIREVAKYMSMVEEDSGNGHNRRKTFGSGTKTYGTSENVLAEVVQVQEGHDRVLDQLNLDVEQLLISSTNEIEAHNYCNVNSEWNRSGSDTCCHQQSLSVDSGVKRKPLTSIEDSYGNTNNAVIDLMESGKGTQSLCVCAHQGPGGSPSLRISHKKSKSETCAYCCTSGGGTTKGGLQFMSTFRRKKSEREAHSDSANKERNIDVGHLDEKREEQHPREGAWKKESEVSVSKPRHHRSYSLIPHWKIKDQFRRLPFLRNKDKLKKTESCSLSGTESGGVNPISVSGASRVGGFFIPSSISSYSLKKGKERERPKNNMSMASVKARSSSMDELRVSGHEEHWYSGDSDTEPDSFTALPSELSKVGMTVINDGLLGLNPPISNSENGSRTDVSTPLVPSVEHIPKPPKFRRGSGIKDKWRESWTQSKTLSKSNMEEENRLLRWFSLRKNHGGSTTAVDGTGTTSRISNRNSTLPLLSEEDLKRISFMEDEEGYWPRRTVLPPTLPIPPLDLRPEQITRRHIVAAIVHSENNYVSALQRLVNEYKKPLECSHPAMLSHSKISTVFHRVPEILQCHSLFRIALAEYIRKWDADEKIGDVFVASFSKSLVLDVYSEFINNFGQAMETAKSEARRKSAFAEFLKVKQMTAHDRLSLFGLMVKPVQRFPQFILLLQDLLKHTPKDHHDRMSLQLALTQLESLAAMLNERKRESEQYSAFRETIKSIGGGKFVLLRSITDDPNRILLRQDHVTQLEFDGNGASVSKSKSRKLLLLNDMLICVTLSSNGSSTSSTERTGRRNSATINASEVSTVSNGIKAEKSVFKWSFPVREVEVEDISISPTMSRYVSNTGKQGPKSDVLPDEEALQSLSLLDEMQSLMHDYAVLSRISELITTLKSSYEGLTESVVKELLLEIQHQIRTRDEQISYFDSSCLTLLLGTGNNREKVVFQLSSPAARNEWIEELRLAQLALDPNNSPAWDVPPESPYPQHRLPLFVRSLPLCRSPHINAVKAGCFFTHTSVSPTGRSKVLDYLWVSCTDGFSSHITAYRSQQNVLKEISAFDLMEEKVNDLLFVSPYVWMATESRKVMIFDPLDTERGALSHYLLSDSVLKLLLFGNVVYAGLADGVLAIFTSISNPKEIVPDKLISLGSDRIISAFGAKDHVYVSCGNAVVTVDTKTHTIDKSVVLTHHNGTITHMACSGVGLWITTQESGTVCLYHLESLQHLQDVSIAPSVFRTVRDSYRRQKGVHVTSLIAHKGWLWIGTNLGAVLTIPLPRLEGVPIISTGKANVSYHGYYGPITFLMPLTKGTPLPLSGTAATSSAIKLSDANDKKQSDSDGVIKCKTNGTKNENRMNSDLPEENEQFTTPPHNGPNLDSEEKTETLTNGKLSSHSPSPSLSNSSSFNESKSGSPLQSIASGLTRLSSDVLPLGLNKGLVVLRKKNLRDSSVILNRNCKTLPRSGPLPLNHRFSIDSDVYGMYGNLINVRGLEDEGRFVDPLYDAMRRSDPELVALDAKINTLDRRLKMRMSRPRSLDLSNWSVDSKISVSSDESVGRGGSRNGQAVEKNGVPPIGTEESEESPVPSLVAPSLTPGSIKKTISRGTKARAKGNVERTLLVVVGGRGYVNMKSEQNYPDRFINGSETESKQCTNLTLWQMKTF